jgi:hypothetical protein
MKIEERIWKSGNYMGRIMRIIEYVAIKIEEGGSVMNARTVSRFNQLHAIVDDFIERIPEQVAPYEVENACKNLARRICELANGLNEAKRNYARLKTAI